MDYLNNPPAILNNRSYSLRRFAEIAKKNPKPSVCRLVLIIPTNKSYLLINTWILRKYAGLKVV